MMAAFAMSTISFDIPQELAASLARFGPDISRTAKEAFLVDLYRRRAITIRALREVLGLARIEVDAVLARHEVSHDLSVEEFDAQADVLRQRLQ
ncbi:MAG: UPF0175 family protein [Planctomycetes bacterium]|nr:UPF0175 family protein [Planctomycetota bacterium]